MYLTRLGGLLAAYQRRDPAARSKLEVFLFYPGVHALLWHRLAHRLYLRKHFFLARWISQRVRKKTGIEIHPGATIGDNVWIGGNAVILPGVTIGSGVVIGETAEIGDDCLLYQGVTLGGTGKDQGKRHPTLGNNVMVGSGARVLGPFKVGDNARIAAGAVVLSEVPPGSTAVGVPARIVRVNGQPVYYADDVDQINVQDPVREELERLARRVKELERALEGRKRSNRKKPA